MILKRITLGVFVLGEAGMAISDKPWSRFRESDYNNDQYYIMTEWVKSMERAIADGNLAIEKYYRRIDAGWRNL